MDNYFIELGGSREGVFRRNYYIRKDEEVMEKIESFVENYNNQDVYYSLFSSSTEDVDNSLLYAPFYLDLDINIECEEDFEKVRKDTIISISFLSSQLKIPEEMIKIFFSGSKGFHVIIDPVILGIEPDKDLNEKFKEVAVVINKNTPYKSVDTRIYDKKRLFRFSNSINSKTDLYKVPMTLDILRSITLSELEEYASEPKEMDIFEEPRLIEEAKKGFSKILMSQKLAKSKKKKVVPVELPTSRRKVLPCVKQILKDGVGKGSRNNTSVALASSLFQSGIKQEEIIEHLLNWNESNDPPLPEREITSTVKSAYSLIKSGRGYGCTFFNESDLCLGEKCELYKK